MLLKQHRGRQLKSVAAAQAHNDLETALLATEAGAVRLQKEPPLNLRHHKWGHEQNQPGCNTPRPSPPG